GLSGQHLLAVIASACSSSSSLKSSSSATTAPTGTPLTLYGLFDVTGPPRTVPFPETKAGFDSAVKAINDAAGVNGHPINGVVCDTQLTTRCDLVCAVGGRYSCVGRCCA